jgi:riboflavin biosynthesis pyrimidine reductase/flavin reductase (DIM6/NTAB) family NADH-FMN oxidoreductase RutF
MTDWAEDAYADLLDRRNRDRAYVVANMVASVDGVIAVDGRTAHLGGPADRELFLYLRTLADVILVGAETVRAERYGPPRVRPEVQAARVARGQEALPRLAIVSRRLDLDPEARVFSEGHRPMVLAPSDADPERLAEIRLVADVLALGSGGVDLPAALAKLGPVLVLCEGGPTINNELVRSDLLDELCLTLAATFVGGPSRGVLGSGILDEPLDVELVSVRARDGDLFLRYRRSGRGAVEPVADDAGGDAASAPTEVFHAVMADLDHPMIIVTAAVDGERSGCLVGFSSQASIEPGRYGVWLSKKNHTHAIAMAAETLVVHFPSEADRPLAELFGTTTGDEIDKFERCSWHEGPDGAPVLDDVVRWFAGRVVDRVDTGDHTLLVLVPTDGGVGPWEGQLGIQAVMDLDAGHPA